MTLPYERRNSIGYAREFLYALLDPKKTPKVPRSVRKWARMVLRHYPSDLDMEMVTKDPKRVFGDPL